MATQGQRLKYVSLGIALCIAVEVAAFVLWSQRDMPRLAHIKRAVEQSDVAAFKSLLPVSINEPEYVDDCARYQYPKQTLLHMVIRESKGAPRSEMIRILFENGADPDQIDSQGNTPLIRAIELANRFEEEGSHAVVKQLLAAGARVNEPSGPYLETPLYRASLYVEPELVEMLISNGANVNARNRNGQTPLHGAAKSLSSDPESKCLILVLLEHGADPTIQDRYGKRAIDWVDECEMTEEIRDLLCPDQAQQVCES